MKTVILALVVLVVVSQGEALRCNCGGTTKPCPGAVETCYGSDPVCGSIILDPPGPHISYIQGCMEASDCMFMSNTEVSKGTCCKTDLCN